ncbi:hypothetical protein GCM10011510_10360 [Streptococcus himalayensis]|uniref:Uncharacterized protein n=1 Tax=Streptococcus himalayensis TaxID=1888195 RepID=A0A917EG15_9STRE|nr:hypothetical protein GCM10011510_10360 [Streptococcus himalayensis]
MRLFTIPKKRGQKSSLPVTNGPIFDIIDEGQKVGKRLYEAGLFLLSHFQELPLNDGPKN